MHVPLIISFCDTTQQSVDGEIAPHELSICKAARENGYELCVKLKEKGHYIGTVKYDGKIVGCPGFTIICLSGKKAL